MFKANDKVVFKTKTTDGEKDFNGVKGVVVKVFDNLTGGAVALVMVDGVAYKVPVAALEMAPEESEKVKGEIAQVVRLTLDDFRDYADKLTSVRYVRDLMNSVLDNSEEIDPEEYDALINKFITVADIVLQMLEGVIFGAVDE